MEEKSPMAAFENKDWETAENLVERSDFICLLQMEHMTLVIPNLFNGDEKERPLEGEELSATPIFPSEAKLNTETNGQLICGTVPCCDVETKPTAEESLENDV